MAGSGRVRSRSCNEFCCWDLDYLNWNSIPENAHFRQRAPYAEENPGFNALDKDWQTQQKRWYLPGCTVGIA
ncbi:hypothetical protein VTO42DRAFT_97 [Malbranchea cinnamomea]